METLHPNTIWDLITYIEKKASLMIRPLNNGSDKWYMRNPIGDRYVGEVVEVSTERLIEIAKEMGWVKGMSEVLTNDERKQKVREFLLGLIGVNQVFVSLGDNLEIVAQIYAPDNVFTEKDYINACVTSLGLDLTPKVILLP